MKLRPFSYSLVRFGLAPATLTGAVLLSPVLAGCSKKQPQITAVPSASASAPSATSVAPPSADPELWSALTNITTACKVDEKQATVTCPQGEHRKLISEFVSNRRSREKAVPTFAAALTDKNPALRAAASNVLYTGFRTNWGAQVQPGAVPAKDATELLNAALAAEKPLLRQALPAAVHACMIANQSEALYAAVEKAKEPQVRSVATRYYMTHGRLQAFEKVRELAKDPDPSVSLAALEAPQNMTNWTPAEQAAICPWATELLNSDRPPVATKAAALLSNCQGEFVDKLQSLAEKALAAGKFTGSTLAGLRDLCSPSRRSSPNGPSEAQCKRSRKLLEKVTEAKNVEEQTRSMALVAVAYQWPDDETLKLAQRLAKSKDAGLADHARRTIQRIEQRKQSASKAAASGAPGSKPPSSRTAPDSRPALPSNPAQPTTPAPAANPGAEPTPGE
ncbi:MAG TPA: hypothetical protein VFQ61_38705 [Polyangiaceae bacterium]|nr:hypothetical protein [Polyangiaceae bacterium]